MVSQVMQGTVEAVEADEWFTLDTEYQVADEAALEAFLDVVRSEDFLAEPVVEQPVADTAQRTYWVGQQVDGSYRLYSNHHGRQWSVSHCGRTVRGSLGWCRAVARMYAGHIFSPVVRHHGTYQIP